MDPVVIVIAGGEGTRWEEHMGISKHFAEVDGEPLIARTSRMLIERGLNHYIVAKEEEHNDFYDVLADPEHVTLYTPRNEQGYADANKFMSSKELWHEGFRTIVLYGDVFFTDEAMDKVTKFDSAPWMLFGRAFGSSFTGKPYGECFAQNFHCDAIADHKAALDRVARLYNNSVIQRCGGWEHYRAMIGIPDELMNQHLVGDKFTHIDDFTDDFDSPEEYKLFLEKYDEAERRELNIRQKDCFN